MNKSKWPKWIRIHYFKRDSDKNSGYEGSAGDAAALYDILDRLDVHLEEIIDFKVDGVTQSETELQQIFKWVAKNRQKKVANEEH